MHEVYKVLQTDGGPEVAHLQLPEGAETMHEESGDDSRFRATRAVPVFIEGNHVMGWGPVDGRTVYRVGEETRAENHGLYLFRKKVDAYTWMKHADI
jgi:hypothetical protein